MPSVTYYINIIIKRNMAYTFFINIFNKNKKLWPGQRRVGRLVNYNNYNICISIQLKLNGNNRNYI